MATVDDHTRKMLSNLEEKTGKPVAFWLSALKESGLEKHGQMVKHLKSEHGLTHGYANLLAHEFRRTASAYVANDDLVAGQYSGKEALRPIYDRLAAEIGAFGSDVELAPKKAYVSLRRKKQFGLVQPSTKTRVDVGIQLKGAEPTERLEASGSFNAMVSHRVRVTEAAEIDDELLAWLRAAYDEAG